MEKINEVNHEIYMMNLYNVERYIYENGVYGIDKKNLLESNNFMFNNINTNIINYFFNALEYGNYDVLKQHILNHLKEVNTPNYYIDFLSELMNKNAGGIVNYMCEILYNINTQFTSDKLYNLLCKYNTELDTNDKFKDIVLMYDSLVSIKQSYNSITD